ncbi:phage antirepressor N-terminal domain-containing protein [Corynebacterium kroppenstedtii]|uniref:phage antirepressor N-terminal domain-containing protein n=1 Tax=Corynebacterium kroppenstedtii TaxID=161879 RepID=UPI00195B9573|nr:phage antirepressor N-terminal domain-containing protein [Corynebacterium kroppenstedtii]MDN8624557.1 phage antirepressor N-terminal domain-containing protein [Corynebacterium kroppenstedtii]QRQ65195.1 phage antirepressor N-terminal domain-containing protein [Corynebacterium kroppenstedtii]
MKQLVTIPVPGAQEELKAVQTEDGTQWAAARHICDVLGIDWGSQSVKLKNKSWATVAMITTVAEDGKQRTMFMVDRRTLTMWLATIDTNRVAPEVRPTLEAFQNEAADALDRYFNEGGAINPRATEHQQKALMFELRSQMELAQAAKGLIHDDFLEAKARIILARGMGETPQLDPARKPLYVQDFLKSKGLSKKQLSAKAPMFGKRLKAAWTDVHGVVPQKVPVELPNGRVIEAYGYTEADRSLMQQVWDEYFAVTA